LKNNELYTYVVVIRNENRRFINWTGFLLSLLSALLFTLEMIESGRIILPLFIGVVFIAGVILYNIYRSRSENKEISYSKALLIAAIIWTKMPYGQWLIFVFVVLAFLEYQAKLPLEIGFSSREVVFNSLFRKRYAWSDLSNVLLKDGLLTVDFQNNKLFQKLVDDGENEATEEEFNEWCRQHLVSTAAANPN
jgi:hypothetical protein